MKCHGRLAASIAGFHRTRPGALTIDRDAFLKAAHVIENECKSFAIRASAKRRGAAIMAPEVIDDAISSFIWCW
jgi:hypothetical protein